MGLAVGIDLGTTNTVVAAVKDGVATTIADTEGNKLIPSVVAFHPNGDVHVGWRALDRRVADPENTVYSVKRLIGRSFQNKEVQEQKLRFPFKLVEGPRGATLVATRAESYALPEISAFVLRRAKAVAEAALGEKVDAAVITVPANFDDPQRASTKMAGKLAGLEVLRILNEPTAAALAYGRSPDATERLCVYDLGGGTFDVTLLDVTNGVFEVLATAGDTALGGDDVDGLIVDRMAEMSIRALRVDPRGNPTAVARMRIAAEALKKELTFGAEAFVEVQDIGRGEGGVPLTLKCRMSRADLERISQPIIDRTMDVTNAAMKSTGLGPEVFDRVILVGGATRMPAIVRRVQELFNKKADQRINPDEVVALGAAIQAHALGSRKFRGKKPEPVRSDEAPPALRANTPPMAAPLPPEMMHAITGHVSEKKDENAKGEIPPIHARPTRRSLRPGADVQEVRSKRFDPRAEPDDDEAPPPAPPPPPAPVPSVRPVVMAKKQLDLPPTRPTMPAMRGDADMGPVAPPSGMTFERPSPELRWSSIPPALGAFSDDTNEPHLPKPPELDISAPPPALPGERASHPQQKPPLPVSAPAKPRLVELAPDDLKLDLEDGESLLIDVTPLSLRVETVGGYSDTLIAANSRVPCDRTRVFSTAADGQTVVFIRVAQGENQKFQENTFLGELELSGLVPLGRGEAQIAVTFEIDADGILAVRAKDGRTGKETQARMHVFGAQTDERDIQQMLHRQRQRAVV